MKKRKELYDLDEMATDDGKKEPEESKIDYSELPDSEMFYMQASGSLYSTTASSGVINSRDSQSEFSMSEISTVATPSTHIQLSINSSSTTQAQGSVFSSLDNKYNNPHLPLINPSDLDVLLSHHEAALDELQAQVEQKPPEIKPTKCCPKLRRQSPGVAASSETKTTRCGSRFWEDKWLLVCILGVIGGLIYFFRKYTEAENYVPIGSMIGNNTGQSINMLDNQMQYMDNRVESVWPNINLERMGVFFILSLFGSHLVQHFSLRRERREHKETRDKVDILEQRVRSLVDTTQTNGNVQRAINQRINLFHQQHQRSEQRFVRLESKAFPSSSASTSVSSGVDTSGAQGAYTGRAGATGHGSGPLNSMMLRRAPIHSSSPGFSSSSSSSSSFSSSSS